jgi:hypothetical protein
MQLTAISACCTAGSGRYSTVSVAALERFMVSASNGLGACWRTAEVVAVVCRVQGRAAAYWQIHDTRSGKHVTKYCRVWSGNALQESLWLMMLHLVGFQYPDGGYACSGTYVCRFCHAF